MLPEPFLDLLARVHRHIVDDQIDLCDAFWQVRVDLVQQGEELDLAFSWGNLAPGLSGAGIETGQ